MAFHETHVKHYNTVDELAREVSQLRYDALAGFLLSLAEELADDSDADFLRGRPKLSDALRTASGAVRAASQDIDQAWKICAPRMKDSPDDDPAGANRSKDGGEVSVEG